MRARERGERARTERELILRRPCAERLGVDESLVWQRVELLDGDSVAGVGWARLIRLYPRLRHSTRERIGLDGAPGDGDVLCDGGKSAAVSSRARGVFFEQGVARTGARRA